MTPDIQNGLYCVLMITDILNTLSNDVTFYISCFKKLRVKLVKRGIVLLCIIALFNNYVIKLLLSTQLHGDVFRLKSYLFANICFHSDHHTTILKMEQELFIFSYICTEHMFYLRGTFS